MVIEIKSNGDSLNELTSKPYDHPSLSKLFIKAENNLSGFGIGVTFKKVPPISHISTALERVFKEIKKHNL